jgi:hypothetical protein
MISKQISLALASITLVGCGIVGNYSSIYFYPTATKTSEPKLQGTLYHLTGTVKLATPDGQEFVGTLKSIERPKDPNDSMFSTELSFPKYWDSIFGESFYSKNVLGERSYRRSILTSASGRHMYIEALIEYKERPRVIGVALDENKQVYKVTI